MGVGSELKESICESLRKKKSVKEGLVVPQSGTHHALQKNYNSQNSAVTLVQ